MTLTAKGLPQSATVRSGSQVLAGGGIAALLVIGITVANEAFATVLPFALLFIATACATWKRLGPAAMSPAFYFAGYLAIVGVLGVLLTNALVGSGGTGGVDIPIDPGLAAATANAMLSAASITLVAASLTRGGGRHGSSNLFDLGNISRYSGWFLFFGTLELAALALFQGSELLERSSRLVGRGSTIETAISMAAVAAVVLVGIAFFAKRGVSRLYALVLLSGFIAYFVAMGTRRLALVPLLILLAYAVSKRGKVSLVAVVGAAAAGLVMLALPLHFRSQATHGLFPYLASIQSFEITPQVIATSFNNFLAGFKITALTGEQPTIPLDVLWISLNPISGDSAGWYEVARTLRLNRFTPYSAIGELVNYGPLVFVLVIAGIGLALGLVQRINDRLLEDTLGRFVAIVALGLVFIFVIQSAQYNLRADVRYLYFALFAQLVGVSILSIRSALGARRDAASKR